MKDNKGITLIALIITIILMLILAAVVLRESFERSLFKQAENSVESIERTQAMKNEMINEVITLAKTRPEYEEDEEDEEIIHNWVRGGTGHTDEFTCSCSTCNGRTLLIGQRIDYIDPVSDDEEAEISRDITGHSAVQYLEKDSAEDVKWVVLGAQDKDTDGTNETLLITTEYPTTSTIRLYGYKPYLNWIDTADEIAEELYGVNARSFTMQDVNECLQHQQVNAMFDNTTWPNLTTRMYDVTTLIKDYIDDYIEYYDEDESERIYDPYGHQDPRDLKDYILNSYQYNITSESATSRAKWVILRGADSSGNGYWLADRMNTYNSQLGICWGISNVSNNWARNNSMYYTSEDASFGDTFKFRVIVELTGEIPALSQEQPVIN